MLPKESSYSLCIELCLFKLVCTLLNTREVGIITATIFLSNVHSLYAPIYLGYNVRLDIISFVWHQSTCQERIESGKNWKMKHSCSQWDSNPQSWDRKSDALPAELAGLRCKMYYLNDLYVYMYFLYIGISSRLMKWSVCCLVNVLFCVTYWNIAILRK